MFFLIGFSRMEPLSHYCTFWLVTYEHVPRSPAGQPNPPLQVRAQRQNHLRPEVRSAFPTSRDLRFSRNRSAGEESAGCGEVITINGSVAEVRFKQFDLVNYALFLKTKKLPESQCAYDWRADEYTITTPARFAWMLGADVAPQAITAAPLAEYLFDYEAFIVRVALESKRYAIFADCGLGKTAMFLEYARHIILSNGGRVLIVSPKQIITQTRDESTRWYGNTLPVERIESPAELAAWCKAEGPGLGITNYQKFIGGPISELRYLTGLILDESSILKTGGGVIKWNLIKSARGIEYKLSCTATPAPNDIMEYASQASFLEKLRTEGEILWTFFSKDKAGNWHIKPHARPGFYRFMASWSLYLRDPSKYGWKDNLKSIPAPVTIEHRIAPTDEQVREAAPFGLGLAGAQSAGITQRSKLSQIAKGFIYEGGKRNSRRIPSNKPAAVAEIIRKDLRDGLQVLVWTVFDEEARILLEHLPELTILDGATPVAQRDPIIEAFRDGEIPGLIARASMLAFGMNFQNCGSMVFSGWDDSYEKFYQAVKRAVRYGQTRSVRVHIPFIPELEGMVLDNIINKRDAFERDAQQQERYYCEGLKGVIRA
jgi:hypothetical protein